MKKLLIIIISGLLVAGFAYGASNLWEYYNGNLPSVAVRGSSAKECGIENYTGTAEQNAKLLECLESGKFGQPYTEEPWVQIMHFNYIHSFDAGLATHGVLRISGTGGATLTTGEFAETLSVTGATSLTSTLGVTGATTLSILGVTGAGTFSANLIANGGVIDGGLYDYGTVASSAITAARFCDYGHLQMSPTYDDDTSDSGNDAYNYTASISLPTEAALLADCLDTEGKCKTTRLENTASVSARLEVYRGDSNGFDLEFDLASESGAVKDDAMYLMTACAVDGTETTATSSTIASISWFFDTTDLSP